jgi:LmbE family N-acetylglucosaminyl deacetylase
MLKYLESSRVMLVVAHPDDEVLGLGATLHKLIQEFNIKTHVVILGEGITSRLNDRDVDFWKTELSKHKDNISSVQKIIGYDTISTYSFPDNRFDSVALLDIVKVIEKEKEFFQPDLIFTHHGGDLNIDHQRTFEAVMTATRPLLKETVKTIITFETPSCTEWIAATEPRRFIPNVFFEVSECNLLAKINAMESYEYEKREFPHPRSPQALKIQAQRWGITIGREYAEAFCLVRAVV